MLRPNPNGLMKMPDREPTRINVPYWRILFKACNSVAIHFMFCYRAAIPFVVFVMRRNIHVGLILVVC